MTEQPQPATTADAPPSRPWPIEILDSGLPGAVIGYEEHRGQLTILTELPQIVATLTRLRDDAALQFDHLADLTAVDYLTLNELLDRPDAPRFALVYQLYARTTAKWLRLKAAVGEELIAPSIVGVYPGADWPEREVFDMFGIQFTHHPNLARLLTADDWQGHPLRKDYPLIEEPVEFTVNTPSANELMAVSVRRQTK